MQRYEYQVIPAPRRAEKVRGVKTSAERFAHALTEVMNRMGRDGWEYLRADALPSEERAGWTKRTTVEQHMLVFRRAVADMPAPQAVAPATGPAIAAPVGNAPAGNVTAPAANAPQGATPPIGPARAG